MAFKQQAAKPGLVTKKRGREKSINSAGGWRWVSPNIKFLDSSEGGIMLTAAEKRKSVSWNSYRRASCTGVFSRSVMSDSAAPWTVDCQNPLPVKFSRQEYWSGVPFPTPEDLPNPGIYPSTAPPALASGFFTTSTTGKPSVLGRVAFSKPGQTEEQVHGSVPGWYN